MIDSTYWLMNPTKWKIFFGTLLGGGQFFLMHLLVKVSIWNMEIWLLVYTDGLMNIMLNWNNNQSSLIFLLSWIIIAFGRFSFPFPLYSLAFFSAFSFSLLFSCFFLFKIMVMTSLIIIIMIIKKDRNGEN